MGKVSILPLPHYFNIKKFKINHYTLPVPQVAGKEKLNTVDKIAKNTDFIRQKQFKTKATASLAPQLSEDTLTLSSKEQVAKHSKKTKHNNKIKGDKTAMAEYFDSFSTKGNESEKYLWYEKVAQEYEAKAQEEARKLAEETIAQEEYWKTRANK